MQNRLLKILLLEDEEADAELVLRQLSKGSLNFVSKVVNTKEDYIAALDQFRPDLILSDNSLPQFSGFEALKIMLQLRVRIPFILVTGTVSEQFAASIMKAGADDYILKDRLTRLPMAIIAALDKRQFQIEKQVAEEKITQSELKYRTLVEGITDAFIALDKQWNFIYVNKRAGQLFNKVPLSLTGKSIFKEFPEFKNSSMHFSYETAMAAQQQQTIIDYYKPFERWFESYVYPTEQGVSVVFRDITESYLQKEKINEQNEALRQIAWKQSHLMRSPLANLKGLVTALKEDKFNTEYYQHIESELDKLDTVIREMVIESSSISGKK